MTAKLVILGLLWCVVLPTRALGQKRDGSAKSDWVTFSLTSKLVPRPVEVGALLPPGYDRVGTPIPLLLFLVRDTPEVLHTYQTTFEQMWNSGTLPKMVVVMPAARRSFFMDYRDGTQRWETFILDEVLSAVRGRFNVRSDRQGTLLAGYSMGGMGALRMAFKYPNRFGAVVAWAPGVEPALAFSEIEPIDKAHRPLALYEEIFGSPVDEKYWQSNHPPYLLKTHMKEIAASGIEIYIAVGREDEFNLYRGAEVMHRMLYEAGVKHEFHLVREANHGTILTGKLVEGLRFLDYALRSVKER